MSQFVRDVIIFGFCALIIVNGICLRENWCDDAEVYQCSAEEKEAMNNETVEFNSFMERLNYLTINTTYVTCDQQNYNVSEDLIWDYRFQMYNSSFASLTECLNCNITKTPIEFQKCMSNIRTTMLLQIDKFADEACSSIT